MFRTLEFRGLIAGHLPLNQHILQLLIICMMFHLQRRFGKITRQTAAARFFGWPIEGGCSPISDVLGGD
jgi:hypothetical protein